MKKNDLIKTLKNAMKLELEESEKFVDLFVDTIKNLLHRDCAVHLHNFGSLHTKYKKPRPGRNPKTGEEVMIKERKVVVYKQSKVLNTKINTIPKEIKL